MQQLSRLAIASGLAIATFLGGSLPAGASTTTAVEVSTPDHFWIGLDEPPPNAIAEQVTITAPTTAPTADVTYAWIMATTVDWTQVGVAWFAGSSPYIFADSDQAYQLGPSIAPGASVTVRLQLDGSTWLDEYRTAAGWQVLQRSVAVGELTPPTVEAYYPGSSSPGSWLFREPGWAAPVGSSLAWHHMAAAAIGAGAPDETVAGTGPQL